jgi:hypothetical protein
MEVRRPASRTWDRRLGTPCGTYDTGDCRPLRPRLLPAEKLTIGLRNETAAELEFRAAVRCEWLLLSRERSGVFHRVRTASVSVL